MEGSDNWVNAVAITPDGRVAVAIGFDLAVRVGTCRQASASADCSVTPPR
jgi:hypothetical protein